MDDDQRFVEPDGLSIRRRRHDRSWSPRDLVAAVRHASWIATGRQDTITPDVLKGIEERNEPIAYATLCLLARGLDCDPVDILGRP